MNTQAKTLLKKMGGNKPRPIGKNDLDDILYSLTLDGKVISEVTLLQMKDGSLFAIKRIRNTPSWSPVTTIHCSTDIRIGDKKAKLNEKYNGVSIS